MSKDFLDRKKELDADTLTDAGYEAESIQSLDGGQAPQPRQTSTPGRQAEMSRTHSYDAFEAVRDFSPVSEEPAASAPDSDSEEKACPPADQTAPSAERVVPPPEDSERMSGMFSPTPIRPEDVNYSQIMEQFTASPTKPKYFYEEFGDYWSCSCGHINQGEQCTNCGLTRKLLKALPILHKPGTEQTKYAQPDVYKGPPATVDQPKKVPRHLTRVHKLLIAIFVILILALCAGLFSYYYVIKPAIEAEKEEEMLTNSQSVTLALEKCASDFNDFLRSSYITAGDARIDTKNYHDGIVYYRMAQNIKETDKLENKIIHAKYKYMKLHLEDDDERAIDYLNQLKDADYKDSAEIYYSYYAWHYSIVANFDEDDYSTDEDKADISDTVYFHVSVSGGPPNGTVDIYYKATWPDGSSKTDTLGTDLSSGSKRYARFQYSVPLVGKAGTFTFKIYNKDNDELLGTDKITFKGSAKEKKEDEEGNTDPTDKSKSNK